MRYKSSFRLQLMLGGAMLATMISPAFAADEPAKPVATDAVPAADPVKDAPADEGQIPDIVVTALKRETNLQKTPIAISVMSSATLTDRHVQSLYDLADGGVPSLRVATFEARQSALTVGIRGIVPLDANQPAREQGVGIYIDGVYLGRQHGLNAGLFDVERIEVLKGPQGTLFGRNTEGGALSIVPRAPSGEFGGRFTGGMGNYGAYNMDGHVDLPEFKGFSLKLDGVIQHQNETTKDPLPGSVGWNYYDRQGFRAAVRWKPTDTITDDFSYDVAQDKNTPFYSQLLNYNPNNCPSGGTNTAPASLATAPNCVLPGTAYTGVSGTIRSLLPGVVVNGTTRMDTADIGVPQQVSVDKTHGFTNTLKWSLAPEIELRSITAWRGVTATQWDNSGGAHRVPVVNLTAACTAAAPCGFSRYSLADLYQHQFSQELQAVGSVSNFDYVAGLYYFNEHVSDDAATPNSNGAVAVLNGAGQVVGANYVILDACTGSAGFGSTVGCRSIDRASEVWSKSYAAYGQVTGNFLEDALHLTVGGRYTHDEKRGVLHFSRNINYDTASAAVLAANGYKPLDKTWNRFNPMATIAYDVSSDIHVYAKYATGYRAGGASSRTADYRAFDPEDVKSYEVGLKTDFWDHKARFNLAAYMMDRKGSQVDLSTIQPTATGNFNNLVTFNAPGTTKIRGIEADLTLQPVEGLTLNASYAYTYTDIPAVPVTYQEFTAAGVPTGKSTTVLQKFYIVFTPRNAASGSIDYSLPISDAGTTAKIHLDANYSQSTQAFDQFATHNDASFIVNGRLSLANIKVSDNQKVTFSVWVRNMFDEQYVFRRDPSNSLPAVQSNAVAGVPNIVTIGNVGNVLGDYGNFNAPRTFGAEISLKF
ncbi:MAG: TonB-dependent receptor [Sphingomonas bacterium]|uniref:TonB-dependent receptor n=1 Tax=Sphingomonas bacterium TaxID=1895847 RepID=UPI00262FA4F9|nr:TonB-dependent receptor [Sphingomonas bacterium]MDB5707495.1 TonB-dependent receptor [Sphingomonas bacterium]